MASEIQPKSSQDHYMSVGFVETRSNEWNGAVDNIIAEIRSRGVERGQLLCIDAHNNGNDGYPIVSAFFDWNTRSSGHLDVAYQLQNASSSWATLYEIASNQAAGIQSDDVISMTGCCNSGGNSVFCVFSEVPSLVSKESIKFVESRSESWNGAADKIIGDLVARGVKKGQLLSIDGHSNGAGEDPTFSAFWNPSLPVKGPLSVGYKFFNADYGWPQFYERIATEANKLKRNDFISITGSVNTTKSSVMYLFYYQ